MIIRVTGFQRCFKSGLAAMIASNKLEDDPIKYAPVCGFGNMRLNEAPYPYTFLNSRNTLDSLFKCINQGALNRLYIIDEAHRILNARLWDKWTKEDTYNLAGIFQDDKLYMTIIYTDHPGKPGNELKGVDLMIRGATWIEYHIQTDEEFLKENDFIIVDKVTWKMRSGALVEVRERMVVDEVHKYFNLYNSREPVS